MRKKYESEELKTIYELTNALCSIDSTIATRSTTADRYWSYILKMWKTHTDAIGCNIMYNILFSIRWGVLPKDTPQNPDLIKLIELAKAEFLKHSQEMRIAKSKNVFKAAYTAVMKSTSPHASPGKHWRSRYFQKFLEDQLQYKLYGGDVIVENLNLVDTPMFEIERMKTAATVRYRYENFRERIYMLLPHAKQWTDKDWVNEKHLLCALNTAFNYDYKKQWREFDALLGCLHSICANHFDFFNILEPRYVPNTVITALCPENPNKRVEYLFNKACAEHKKFAAYSKRFSCNYNNDIEKSKNEILNSWLYQKIQEWRTTDTYPISHKTKTNLFEIMIGID